MLLDSIERLCRENGTNFAKLERDLKIGNGVISRWKTSSPRIDNIKKVADYFGVTVDELLSDNNKETDR